MISGNHNLNHVRDFRPRTYLRMCFTAHGFMRTRPHRSILWAMLLASTASGVQQEALFRPSVTDPAITQFNDRHYAVVDPAVTGRGRLVLFLPGTGATPFLYREFPKNAASLGFHALGLMYPNDSAINVLSQQFAPSDPDAAGNARLEVIDGSDRVSFLVVNTINSIQHRLLKALQYLQSTYPLQGWGQYCSGSSVRWDKLIVCGHSQGSGMAAMLAKTRVTDRCIIFTGMDWWTGGTPPRPYNWMFTSPQTPVDRWYSFAHERDQFLDFAEMQVAAAALDVSRYGSPERVESSSAGYRSRHFLSTNLEPASTQSSSYHGCPVVDAATPRQADGVTPVFKPVWDYLLLHDTQPITIECTPSSVSVIFSPGTLEQSDDLIHWTPQPVATSPLVVPRGAMRFRSFYRLQMP
jgi:hypothetical protein